MTSDFWIVFPQIQGESDFYKLVWLEQISFQSRVVGWCISLEAPALTHNVAKDLIWMNTSASLHETGRSAWDDDKTSLTHLVNDLCQWIACSWSQPMERTAA